MSKKRLGDHVSNERVVTALRCSRIGNSAQVHSLWGDGIRHRSATTDFVATHYSQMGARSRRPSALHVWQDRQTYLGLISHVPHRSQRRQKHRKISSGARGAYSTRTVCKPGCRSDLDSPHGQSGAVRGKPMAHPAQTPERGGSPRCARAPTPKSW